MRLLQGLPSSLCEFGPNEVDGVGNFHIQVLARDPSKTPLATLYFLDSHGQISSQTKNPDYDYIRQSQIKWFKRTSRSIREICESTGEDGRFYLSLAFFHIPFPEFADSSLEIRSGHRREPTEGPGYNSRFYDALVEEGVSALGCGHDHVNDFCALLPRNVQQGSSRPGPWLCYGGGSGFGGYCSYGKERYHRRMRVWQLDTETGSLRTWKRVEYAADRVDETLLVDKGAAVDVWEARSKDKKS